MPSVGFEGALGQEAMAEQIRQRLMDELNKTKTLHGMSVEDQRLALEKQRFDQEAQDRALLRSQQGTAFNETLAEKTAANLTPQSIISPELATRFKNTSLAPLISADQTLPSTSLAGAESLAGAPASEVAPTVTQHAPTLTGQLRYAGTPTQVKTSADETAISQMANDPKTSPAIRGFLQMRLALPKGENIPYQLITEPNGPQKPGVIHDTANGLVRIGEDNTVTPITGTGGKPVQGYHPPVSANPNDASAIADAIESGIQPPDTKGLFRLAGPVRAELAKRGYDLSTANLDWQATQKHLATLNGPQQTRLRQAIGTATDSLDVIQQLTDAWDGGRFPILNKANLAIAKNGGYGKEAASIATQLEGQITDVVSELGNIYMGGNAPTDHALVLAQKNLSADWDRKVLTDMIALARKNIQIRANSIANAGAVTASSQQQAPPTGPSTPPTKLSADDLLKKYGR